MTDFEFEPDVPGTEKKPDYMLRVYGSEVFLEVKEFRAKPEDFRLGGGFFDPYGPIREKINAARKKFKDMEGRCCCLILHNQEKPLVTLEWQIIMAAMLGDLGFSFPVNLSTGVGDSSKTEQVTLGGGKMHRHEGEVPIAPENRTISAILVVERYMIGQKRFQLFAHEREQTLGRDLTVEEYLGLAEESVGTERDVSLNTIRIRVHENPYAKVQLDRRLFAGPFDERYGEVEKSGRWGRVYIGKGAGEFERKSAAAKLLSKT